MSDASHHRTVEEWRLQIEAWEWLKTRDPLQYRHTAEYVELGARALSALCCQQGGAGAV